MLPPLKPIPIKDRVSVVFVVFPTGVGMDRGAWIPGGRDVGSASLDPTYAHAH